MNMSLPNFPKITEFISQLSDHEETFLYERMSNTNYGFWPEFDYFLSHLERFDNFESNLKRLSVTAPFSMGIDKAWNMWRIFRSAQSEITVIFLIEKYLQGLVVEIIAEDAVPTPDLRIRLDQNDFLVEIKAQSGQQHGDKHPMARGATLFDPKDECDLKSWLFEDRVSSRNGKVMKPKVLEAEDKGADILVAMIDIFNTINDIESQVSFICPNSNFMEMEEIQIGNGKSLKLHFFKALFPVSRQLSRLKEIWLFDESHLDRFIVLSDSMVLFNHLRAKR